MPSAKSIFTFLYSPARERAFMKRNILAGWSKSGLYPFNLDRELKDLPKPTTDFAGVNEVTAGPTLHDAVLTAPMTPVLPATPVTPVFSRSSYVAMKSDSHT